MAYFQLKPQTLISIPIKGYMSEKAKIIPQSKSDWVVAAYVQRFIRGPSVLKGQYTM